MMDIDSIFGSMPDHEGACKHCEKPILRCKCPPQGTTYFSVHEVEKRIREYPKLQAENEKLKEENAELNEYLEINLDAKKKLLEKLQTIDHQISVMVNAMHLDTWTGLAETGLFDKESEVNDD
jgi:hypothetical protein